MYRTNKIIDVFVFFFLFLFRNKIFVLVAFPRWTIKAVRCSRRAIESKDRFDISFRKWISHVRWILLKRTNQPTFAQSGLASSCICVFFPSIFEGFFFQTIILPFHSLSRSGRSDRIYRRSAVVAVLNKTRHSWVVCGINNKIVRHGAARLVVRRVLCDRSLLT